MKLPYCTRMGSFNPCSSRYCSAWASVAFSPRTEYAWSIGESAMMKKTRMVTPKIMIGNAMRRRPINRSRLLTVSPFRFVGSKARLH